MKIESVSFGSIMIDGKKHTSDLIIHPDGRIQTPWRRSQGHRLTIDDIGALIHTRPEVIVAGTGINGRMKPGEGLESFLVGMHIAFFQAPNENAMRIFNGMVLKKRTGACFHLTC